LPLSGFAGDRGFGVNDTRIAGSLVVVLLGLASREKAAAAFQGRPFAFQPPLKNETPGVLGRASWTDPAECAGCLSFTFFAPGGPNSSKGNF
jgi:hypothetical protein